MDNPTTTINEGGGVYVTRRMLSRALRALAVSVSLLIVFASVALGSDSARVAATEQQPAAVQITQETVAVFDPYVSYDSRQGYHLTGIPNDATKAEVAAVRAMLDKANRDDRALRAVNKRDSGAKFLRDGKVGILMATEVKPSSGGVSQIVHYWWGYDFYMNHEDTQEMAHALTLTAAWSAIATIAVGIWPGVGLIPCGIMTVITILIGIGAGELTYYDHGNGVIVRALLYIPAYVMSQ